jgi:hypothetical protein
MRNSLILVLALSTTTLGCWGKEPLEPDSLWNAQRRDITEIVWNQKHAGADALSYPYEDSVGLPYPDGLACEVEHEFVEAETAAEEEYFYTLNRWITSGGGEESGGDFKVVTAPMRAETELITYCPAHGRTVWSNDLVHGTIIHRDGRGRIDSWSYRSARDAGPSSQTPQGFVGELFAPFGAVAITKFSFPDARLMADSRVVNDQVSELYNSNPCGLHASHYYADDWIDAGEVDVSLGQRGAAGISFTPTTHIESDVVATRIRSTLEWGGDGTDVSALCSAELGGVNDGGLPGDFGAGGEEEEDSSRCEEFCAAQTVDPVEYSECVEDCIEAGTSPTMACQFELEEIPSPRELCVPGEGIFEAVWSPSPSKGAASMLLPVEITSGQPGAASVITSAPPEVKVHARMAHGGWDFGVDEVSGLSLPLGLAYINASPGTEVVIKWECDPGVTAEAKDGPTWIIEDVYGDVDIVVYKTWIPHVNHDNGEREDMPAYRIQVEGRRDIVTLPLGAPFNFMDMELRWNHDNETATLGSRQFSAQRLR